MYTKISEFKAHLSAYLARARAGETIVVCDRRTPVARLVPFDSSPEGLEIREPSTVPARVRRIRGVRPTAGDIDVVALLRQDRDQR